VREADRSYPSNNDVKNERRYNSSTPNASIKWKWGISRYVWNAGISFRIEATGLQNVVSQKAPLFYTICGAKIQRTTTLKKYNRRSGKNGGRSDSLLYSNPSLRLSCWCYYLENAYTHPIEGPQIQLHHVSTGRTADWSPLWCVNAADVARTQHQYMVGDSRPTGDRVCYLDRTSYRGALGSKAICFIGAIWRQT
jgi:hypothetical protein